jgi:phosphotransacetylase
MVPCDFTPRRSAATIESANTFAIAGSSPTAAMMSMMTFRSRSTE